MLLLRKCKSSTCRPLASRQEDVATVAHTTRMEDLPLDPSWKLAGKSSTVSATGQPTSWRGNSSTYLSARGLPTGFITFHATFQMGFPCVFFAARLIQFAHWLICPITTNPNPNRLIPWVCYSNMILYIIFKSRTIRWNLKHGKFVMVVRSETERASERERERERAREKMTG